MDRSRRTYCVAPALPWFKFSWFSSLGTLKNSSLCHGSKWHSNFSTASWRWLSDNPQHLRNFLTCSAVHDKTCSVMRRSTRKTFGTLTIKCQEGKECPYSERRIFRTHVDLNFFYSCGV
jgi:hypothetical protein